MTKNKYPKCPYCNESLHPEDSFDVISTKTKDANTDPNPTYHGFTAHEDCCYKWIAQGPNTGLMYDIRQTSKRIQSIKKEILINRGLLH